MCILRSFFFKGSRNFWNLLDKKRELFVKEDRYEVHRDDEGRQNGAIRHELVAHFFVDVLFDGFDQEEQQHGDGQGHQNGFEVNKGQVNDDPDNRYTFCRGSL